MKRISYTILLLISVLLLTGCGEQTYKFESSEIIYELSGTMVDDINANGANVIVNKNQAFVEFNEDTQDYNTYAKGEHKIEKKDSFYKYYFINLSEVKGKKFGSEKGIKLTDETYGEVTVLFYGTYDYTISNVKDFTSTYLKLEEIVDIEDYVEHSLQTAVKNAIINLDKTFKELALYSENIKTAVVEELVTKGISVNLTIESINLDEASLAIVNKHDTNQAMYEAFIKNTSWVNVTEGSELKLLEGDFKWFGTQGNYNGDVQYGDFKFYIDDMAVDFITQDLKSYGVTTEELQKLFDNNEEYDKSNFVVFSINLEGYTVGGQTTTVNQTIYWYGFLLSNNQNLQVVNMSTATYYNFMKK